MIGCLTETTTCVVAKPLLSIIGLHLELLDTTHHACVGSVGLISDVYRSCSDLTVKPDIDHLNVLQKLVHLVQHPDTGTGR